MIFNENRLPADDSHEISYLILFKKSGKMSQNLSSAAVVIGALRIDFCFLPTAWIPNMRNSDGVSLYIFQKKKD